jgi:hypothetical protein
MNRWISRTAAAAVLVLSLPLAGHGQVAGTLAELGAQLRERYDVVALQRGVALVPRQAGSSIRLIQIEGGVVTVDGQALTGAQLRDRLGRDADLIVQASYLTPQQQRELAGAASGVTAVAPAPTGTAEAVVRTAVSRGDRVRFGESLRIAANERVEGDVVVFGGSADVDGEITEDLVVFGGSLRLGPQAVVRGEVTVMGGSLDRAPGAQIFGRINEVTGGPWMFRRGWRWSNLFGSFWSRVGSLAATVLRLTLFVLLGFVIVAFGRNAIEQVAARTAATPLRSGLIGLLAEVLFLPVLIITCVVLAVSIVGIPLLALVPFAVLLLMLVMLVGFVGLAFHVGRRLAATLGWVEPGPYAALAIGVVTIGAVTLVAKLGALAGGFLLAPLTAVGYFVEYVAWTVGFGAALLYWYETQTRFGPRRQAAPATPTPSPSGA